MSYHSLKRLIQGWWKQLQENKKPKKQKKKEKKGQAKAYRTLKGPLWQLNVGSRSSWGVLTPASLPKCSSAAPQLLCTLTSHFHAVGLILGYTSPIYMCIIPLKLHSLSNDKVCKALRCRILCSSSEHLFSAVSTWDSQNLVLSKTLSGTSDNTTHKHNVT